MEAFRAEKKRVRVCVPWGRSNARWGERCNMGVMLGGGWSKMDIGQKRRGKQKQSIRN